MAAAYQIEVKPSCIGKWAVIIHRDICCVGTVIDNYSDNDWPRRIRIQRGPFQGNVVQPHEYTFKSFLEDDEIDP